jgi:hypothetical protein
MNDCRRYRDAWTAFLAGKLGPEGKARLERHLDRCPSCRKEVESMKRVIEAADLVKDEMGRAMASVDWEVLPARITDNVLAAGPGTRRAGAFARFFAPIGRPLLRPVLAGAAMGIFAGVLATFVIMKRPAPRAEARGGFYASPEFIERAENEMARRETLDYLRNSQYLILDFVQSSPADAARGMDLAASGRARDLLAKKKFLNTRLDGARMVQAKAICDQIELLFLELSRLGQGLPEAEIRRIQNLIEDSRLLLKINLAEKELEESEA